MKGRQPILESEEDAIHYYIGEYYKECSKTPDIRFDADAHLELVQHINERYTGTLKRNTAFDYDKFENCFMECIDFLTKIITKRREKMEKSGIKKDFLKQLHK